MADPLVLPIFGVAQESLVLRSLKPIRKTAREIATGSRWPSPHPGLGAVVELLGGDSPRLLDLGRIRKALARQGVTTEEAPPALLQIQPACACRDKDVMQARMLGHPGAGLGAVVAGEIVRDQVQVARRVRRFDVSQQSTVIRGVARGGRPGEFFPVPHPQRAIDPHLFWAAAVIELGLDARPSG